MWFKVKGTSMHPAFKEGDKVIAFKSKKLKTNDVVVIKNPGCFDSKRVIKRIKEMRSGVVYVVGDNRNASRDSRQVGWVESKYIIGKVYGVLPGGKMNPKAVFEACFKWICEEDGI